MDILEAQENISYIPIDIHFMFTDREIRILEFHQKKTMYNMKTYIDMIVHKTIDALETRM